MDALEALRSRRAYGRLVDPPPTDEQLLLILERAAVGPDHGALRPVRFVVLRHEGLNDFGAVLESAYLRRSRESGEQPVEAKALKERSKLQRAPLVIVVAAVPQSSESIPWSDQRDAAAAAAMSILIAAHALGYGAMWRTGDICEDADVKCALAINSEAAIVGFIYIGTISTIKEPKTADMEGLVGEYRGSSTHPGLVPTMETKDTISPG
jgi:nitroreductase